MNILYQIADTLRNTGNARDYPVVAIALLTWAKLSHDGRLEESLRINSQHQTDKNSLYGALVGITEDDSVDAFVKQAFLTFLASYSSYFRDNDQGTAINEAVVVADDYVAAGLLSNENLIDVASWVDHYTAFRGEQISIPKEIADLMVSLGEIQNGDDVCTEWDIGAQLGMRASTKTPNVHVESRVLSPLPLFASILSGVDITFETTDPILNPVRIEDGTLHRYDASISFPPLGLKNPEYKKAADKDWYGRFPEKTNQGGILAIRHALSITNRTAVIAVQEGILFSPGAGRALRENLIGKGVVSTVISLPGGLLPHTNIGFSILVLTPSQRGNKVRFVDLNDEQFIRGQGKGKYLVNVDEIVALILSGQETEHARNVGSNEIGTNDFNLNVGRYLLDPETQAAQSILKQEKTTKLSQLAKIVRPVFLKKGEVGALEVLEIGAADIPERGFIPQPTKQSVLPDDHGEPGYFLRPNDIVLIIKGSTGKVGIVSSDTPPPGDRGWVVGQSAIILRAVGSEIDSGSLLVYLRSEIGQALLKSIISGSTIPFIKLSDLRELPVIIPAADMSEKIIQILNKEDAIEQQVAALRQEQVALANNIWKIA